MYDFIHLQLSKKSSAAGKRTLETVTSYQEPQTSRTTAGFHQQDAAQPVKKIVCIFLVIIYKGFFDPNR